MPSIQKQFRISETFDFNFGTQSGINLADQWDEKEFAYFNCGIGNYHCFAQVPPYEGNDKPSGLVIELNFFGWDLSMK